MGRKKKPVCNRDCFNCIYEDCIDGSMTHRDYQEQAAIEKELLFPKTAAEKKVAATQKAYREANREKVAEYHKAYYEANREKVAATQKAYYEANREKLAKKRKKKREQKRNEQEMLRCV